LGIQTFFYIYIIFIGQQWHDVYKDSEIRTRQRTSFAAGLKAPTGRSDHRNSNGELAHTMMQTGSGSWDAVASLNGTLALGEKEDGGAAWFVSPSLFYQYNTANDLGYKKGNRINYKISTRYRSLSK